MLKSQCSRDLYIGSLVESRVDKWLSVMSDEVSLSEELASKSLNCAGREGLRAWLWRPIVHILIFAHPWFSILKPEMPEISFVDTFILNVYEFLKL